MAKKQNKKTSKTTLTLNNNLIKDIKNHSKEFNYSSSSEFIRGAIPEKLYGKNIKE